MSSLTQRGSMKDYPSSILKDARENLRRTQKQAALAGLGDIWAEKLRRLDTVLEMISMWQQQEDAE